MAIVLALLAGSRCFWWPVVADVVAVGDGTVAVVSFVVAMEAVVLWL